MCDPVVGGAIATGGSALIKAATSPDPNIGNAFNYTSPGASREFAMLAPYLQGLLRGGNAPDIGNLNAAYALQRQNLQGAEQRAVGQAGLAGAAQAGSMNLSNPYLYSNFLQNRVQGEYAPEFGNLAASQAQGLFGANRSLLTQLLQGQNQLIGLGAGAPHGGIRGIFNYG